MVSSAWKIVPLTKSPDLWLFGAFEAQALSGSYAPVSPQRAPSTRWNSIQGGNWPAEVDSSAGSMCPAGLVPDGLLCSCLPGEGVESGKWKVGEGMDTACVIFKALMEIHTALASFFPLPRAFFSPSSNLFICWKTVLCSLWIAPSNHGNSGRIIVRKTWSFLKIVLISNCLRVHESKSCKINFTYFEKGRI